MSENTSSSDKNFRAALVQMCATRDPVENVAIASDLIREAAQQGASYIQTPEVTNLMETERERMFSAAEMENGNTALEAFRSLAKHLNVWLHIGSMAVRLSNDKLANRSYVIAPDGSVAAQYDKIHMFDVTLTDERRYDESRNYQAGDKAVTAQLPWGQLGITICYDVRFAYLHRTLAQSGAHFLAVPAAFTQKTGEAHWHTLLKARAIETGCFVFAAGQTGLHECGRETYGHSLIVSPWGEVLADAGKAPGVIVADIDVAKVAKVRQQIPALTHDRDIQ